MVKGQTSSLPCNNNIFCDPAVLPIDIYENNDKSVLLAESSAGKCTCTLLRQAYNNDNQQENIIIIARALHKSRSYWFRPSC